MRQLTGRFARIVYKGEDWADHYESKFRARRAVMLHAIGRDWTLQGAASPGAYGLIRRSQVIRSRPQAPGPSRPDRLGVSWLYAPGRLVPAGGNVTGCHLPGRRWCGRWV